MYIRIASVPGILIWNLPLILSSVFPLVPCALTWTPPVSWQTEIVLFSHFVLHLFSGVSGMGSLEPESLLASLSIAKQGCAAPREGGEGTGTALPRLHRVPRKHKPLLGQL